MAADGKGPRPDYVKADERGVDPKVIRDEHRPSSQEEIASNLVDVGLEKIARMPEEEQKVLAPSLTLLIPPHIGSTDWDTCLAYRNWDTCLACRNWDTGLAYRNWDTCLASSYCSLL